MAKRKYVYYVGVLMNDGTCKFVTELNYTTKYAKWESGKDALEMPMSLADDIVLGLLMNFIYAFTIKVPYGITFANGTDKESEGK